MSTSARPTTSRLGHSFQDTHHPLAKSFSCLSEMDRCIRRAEVDIPGQVIGVGMEMLLMIAFGLPVLIFC